MQPSFTDRQLEVLKDLHLATKQGFAGVSIRKGEQRKYATFERAGLIYFLSGFGGGYSVRPTDKGVGYLAFTFAYAYADSPHKGQTTYQNADGEVVLVA